MFYNPYDASEYIIRKYAGSCMKRRQRLFILNEIDKLHVATTAFPKTDDKQKAIEARIKQYSRRCPILRGLRFGASTEQD